MAFVVERTLLVRGFLLELTDALTIGPDATHAAFILFDKEPELISTFADSSYYSGEDVHYMIEGLPNGLGRRTFIDRALTEANLSLFSVEGGDRPKFSNVLILLTDGKTNPASEPFSSIIPSLQVRLQS